MCMRIEFLASIALGTLAMGGCMAAGAQANSPAPAQSAAQDAEYRSLIEAATASADRSDKARALDQSRKPAEVLEFFGLRPGMDAADLFPGAGYWTEIMAHVVGPNGSVTALEAKQFHGGERGKAHWAKLTERLPGVALEIFPFENFAATPNSYDFAIMNLNYHDLYWESEKYRMKRIDPKVVVKRLYAAMRPGGIVGIIDHVGPKGDTRAVVDKFHRIDPLVVIADFESQGFKLVDRSDLLANPQDDHTLGVFDPAIRGKTDRFMLKFRKPARP